MRIKIMGVLLFLFYFNENSSDKKNAIYDFFLNITGKHCIRLLFEENYFVVRDRMALKKKAKP